LICVSKNENRADIRPSGVDHRDKDWTEIFGPYLKTRIKISSVFDFLVGLELNTTKDAYAPDSSLVCVVI
jgi:hypothetical protein